MIFMRIQGISSIAKVFLPHPESRSPKQVFEGGGRP
jgi:hypothetical protein